MKYLSMYRKYRPSTFEEVVEQDSVVRILRNQVKSNSIAHAYLFTGTRGTGKTTIARIFARAINCDSPINGSPCGECESCRVLKESNTDIYELDAASNNGVDNIREIRDSVQYQPLYAKYKVYIIDEVHQLTTAASNAFLKTLEEPPEYCVFILATTDPQKIPQTILSRCLKLDFKLVSNDGLSNHIANILDKEGVPYTTDAVNLIANAGEGSVRDALSVLEACISARNESIDYNLVLEVLGANNPEFIANTVNALLSGDISFALSQVQFASSSGKNISVLSKDILKYLRDLLIIRSNKDAENYLKLPKNLFDLARQIANSYGSAEIVRALEVFTQADAQIKMSTTPRFILETAIAKCCSSTDKSILSANSRLDSLERKIEEGYTVTKIVKEIQYTSNNAPVSNPVDNVIDGAVLASADLPFEVEEAKPVVNDNVTEYKKSENKEDKVKQKTVNLARTNKLKSGLISKFTEQNKVFIVSVLSDSENYIFVNNGYVDIVVSNKLDADMLIGEVEVIKKFTQEILGNEYNINIKASEGKADNDSFMGQFSTNKIIVKK